MSGQNAHNAGVVYPGFHAIHVKITVERDFQTVFERLVEKTQISEFEFDRNNIDKTLKNQGDDSMDEDDSDDDDEGKQKEEKDGPIKIASGIYAFKFMITQTSWNSTIISNKFIC